MLPGQIGRRGLLGPWLTRAGLCDLLRWTLDRIGLNGFPSRALGLPVAPVAPAPDVEESAEAGRAGERAAAAKQMAARPPRSALRAATKLGRPTAGGATVDQRRQLHPAREKVTSASSRLRD